MKKDKDDQLKPAFCKSSKQGGSSEIWMMLIEKAIAKMYGSYEASEGQSTINTF
jgi:hypothetical protein